MKLEEGKRYVTECGKVTGKLKLVTSTGRFHCPINKAYYDTDGKCKVSKYDLHLMDIKEEYLPYATPTNTPAPAYPHLQSTPINPSHYTQGEVECIDAIKAALTPEEFKGFLRGNIIKYAWRCGLKDSPSQEMKKAEWYLTRLLKELENGKTSD